MQILEMAHKSEHINNNDKWETLLLQEDDLNSY